MRYLTVVPARGGSKGIKKKNIIPVCGKPLLTYTLEAAISAEIDGDVVVSTDAEDIAVVAGKSGIEVIMRPKELGHDNASTEDVLLHALEYMREKHGKKYDAVVTLQPTSPLRNSETIKKVLLEYQRNIPEYDSLLTLHEDRTDFWIKKENGIFGRLNPLAPRRRQEREPLYVENSCIYVTDVQALIETKSVLGHKTGGYVISFVEGVDINEPQDLILAEYYLNGSRSIIYRENIKI